MRIDTRSGTVTLSTDSGKTISAHRLALTYNTSFSNIFIDGNDKTGMLQRRPYAFVHIHLLLNDPELRKLSYWRIFNNAMIHRISDMSRQLKLDKDERLICVGLYSSFMENRTEEEARSAVLASLRAMKVVSDSARVIEYAFSSYKGSYTDLYALKHIESESKGLAEVLNTLDISRGIRENLHKYATVNYKAHTPEEHG